ncbi:hypothetical protein KGF56_002942 [Candida oxycetoniae]|uniref:tRNA (guanine(10)-N(2))-methyltransferase n=1 Tax=Candida oxycetoniae TaxID=497107 RepID=A0AAI9WXQ2_9ASCO|nr:uncharacterized protein KGF56_002942 [Candida oxycetoniae]KAI3404303.2 hypothetical protein KGF56_002942 [Candida oxycetoniae]
MKSYLVQFAQAHPKFRKAELEALAELYNIPVDLSKHNESIPFLEIKLKDDDQARALVSRAILSKGIYELWGSGTTYENLFKDIREQSQSKFAQYKNSSFKFEFESFKGRQSHEAQMEIMESLSFLGLKGRINLKTPDETFTIFEEYQVYGMEKAHTPKQLWFGRLVQLSERIRNNIVEKYDLKKRSYIGTTSFDAELSLVSCNLAHVQEQRIVYDPFAGTGSFLVAAAGFGALNIGSDIDTRMLSGKDNVNIATNFKDYGTSTQFIDVMTMDFTHNALRSNFVIDTIICDPPYGVREGLRVLGAKNKEKAAGRETNVVNGEIAHLRRDFIHPKKPYELSSLLDDLLQFASVRLPIGGRLAFWMPTANDDFEITLIPQHKCLELKFNLEQQFNKWSRRLLVYVKRDQSYIGETRNGLKELNIKSFRERYFHGFSESSR